MSNLQYRGYEALLDLLKLNMPENLRCRGIRMGLQAPTRLSAETYSVGA